MNPFSTLTFFRIIGYAKSKNIVVHSSTNGNLKFDNEKAEKLVNSGLDSLVFAVDGGTQETYSTYRKGGNLYQVLENIKTIVRVKKEKGSKTPYLNMRFVVMRHNERELRLVKAIAEELGVDYFTLKTVDMPPALGEAPDSTYSPENKKYQRYEYKNGNYERKQRPFSCMRPWKRITLDASGEIIPCEFDYKNLYSFGNVSREKSSVAVWKGKKATDFRKKFNLGNNDSSICKGCSYKDMVADDCVVEKISLTPAR